MKRSAEAPWSVGVSVHDIPASGQRFSLAADGAARAAVAKLAGLRSLPRLEADFTVSPHGHEGLHIVGRISATVGQTCVVTLEPIESDVEEAVDLIYTPGPMPEASLGEDGERARSSPKEGLEPLVGGRVDLGAIATEFLILGVDPYPRKPGATFEAPSVADHGGHPFAALAALKKGQAENDC
jgi:hypothetical protein